jgi:hypothetical protein
MNLRAWYTKLYVAVKYYLDADIFFSLVSIYKHKHT